MDVRARAATLLSRFSFNSELRVTGFAPRHLNRSAFLYIINLSEE